LVLFVVHSDLWLVNFMWFFLNYWESIISYILMNYLLPTWVSMFEKFPLHLLILLLFIYFWLPVAPKVNLRVTYLIRLLNWNLVFEAGLFLDFPIFAVKLTREQLLVYFLVHLIMEVYFNLVAHSKLKLFSLFERDFLILIIVVIIGGLTS
jgi:hypothetical protein